MTNLMIREWLNAGLIPLNACILIMIGHSLFLAYMREGAGWTRTPGVMSAFAIWWIFFAELIRASMAWKLLNDQSEGHPMEYLGATATMAYGSAAVILVIATLRLIYALSPKHWGHKGWISSAVLTFVFIAAVSVFA